MILELAHAGHEGDVVLARDVLVAQEQHPVPEQRGVDFTEQSVVVRGIPQAHAEQFGADVAAQLFYPHGGFLAARIDRFALLVADDHLNSRHDHASRHPPPRVASPQKAER